MTAAPSSPTPAPAQWRPRVAVGKASPDALDKATKLRAVLEPILRGRKLDIRSQAEREAAGVEAYRKEFGHSITTRWFRALLERTEQRDGGREDWMRLELYLDADAKAAPRPAKADQPAHAVHEAALGDSVRTLDNAAKPTLDDKKFLFDATFRHLENSGKDWPAGQNDFKRTLIDWLCGAVPTLVTVRTGESPHAALRCMFNRKWRAWMEAGGVVDALQDQRVLNSGRTRPDFSADLALIRNEAIKHGGNQSLAYRKLRQAGKLSDAFVNHYKFNPRRNKSYVPRPVRDAITPEVEMCGPNHLGPDEVRKRAPYVARVWSGVQPGDWYSGDDETPNNYFWFFDADGQKQITRGELIWLPDLASGCMLDWELIAGRFNSRHVLKLWLRGHDRHGLPHQGLYVENSIFGAKRIDGVASKNWPKWREIESNLAQYNLQVRHTQPRNPRSKPVEGLIRILQDRRIIEAGNVNGDERRHKAERMQAFLAQVRAGKADPAEMLLSMDQWKSRLDAIFNEYNAEPQTGKMLRGASPIEAWQEGLSRRPLRKLPDNARHILSTDCRRIRVRQEGIVLNIGKNRMLYCNEQTGRMIGRDVLAYPDVEREGLLTVTDLNGQNPFTVKSTSLPAMSATKEQFHAVKSQIAAHTRHAREIYGDVKHARTFTITHDVDPGSDIARFGEFHNAETARFKTEQAAETRTLRKIQLASPGRPIPADIRNPSRVLAGIEMENDWRKEQEAAVIESCEIPAPVDSDGSRCKSYTLDAAPGPVPSVALYWRLWAQVEKAKPGLDLHALTQKSIHCHPLPREMTPEQLSKMIDTFSAILRDSKKAAAL
ncbi:MAG TPA: hypothetical protein VGR14_17440 [Verrucomicrobiae bacterium]|nr:hypothetical protein [Verrucomicrobiae bacterium]